MAEANKSFGEALSQVLRMWGGLSLRQRWLLGGGAVLAGATLWIFVALIGKPKMVTLYTGLKPGDAQSMGTRLAAKNITYELSPDGGTLLVAADQLDASRLETASQGLPRNARLGFELFDSPNWAGSDFTEKVNYQRALEGELERTLQTLGEVESVRVHLVLPRESLFTAQERQAKAAVILKMRGGRLSDPAQQAIPQLVASAVDGLRPENVTVVDADSNTPLLHARASAGANSYNLDEELAKTVVHTLEPVVGAEHVRASVHVEYDLSTSENTEEIYDPKTTAALTQQKSEENAGGPGAAGVPGTASNLPGGTVPVTSLNADSQSSRSESATFAVSKSVRHTLQPPGQVKRIAAAVLVDDAIDTVEKDGTKTEVRRKRTPEEMKEIEQLATAALGLNSQRGDLLALENLSFQQAPQETLQAPTKVDKVRTVVTEWSWMLRYLGVGALFGIVYLLMLRPIKKQLVTAFRELPGRLAQSQPALGQAGGHGSPAMEIELPSASDNSRRATALKKQLTDKVKAEPAASSRLVQSWIREAGAE